MRRYVSPSVDSKVRDPLNLGRDAWQAEHSPELNKATDHKQKFQNERDCSSVSEVRFPSLLVKTQILMSNPEWAAKAVWEGKRTVRLWFWAPNGLQEPGNPQRKREHFSEENSKLRFCPISYHDFLDNGITKKWLIRAKSIMLWHETHEKFYRQGGKREFQNHLNIYH